MAKSDEVCSVIMNKLHELGEAKESDVEEKDRQKEAKGSQSEDQKDAQKEGKVSSPEDEDMQKVREIDNKNKQREAKVSGLETNNTLSIETEEQVSPKKAKVSFRLDLEPQGGGDDSTSCSDMSFEVTDNTSTQSDSHGSQSVTTNHRIKKHRKRQSKRGSRHRTQQQQPKKDGFQSPQFGKKALVIRQKAFHRQERDDAAALSRFSDEQHLVLFPSAPFNSTQYLMDDQYKNSPQEDIAKWLASSASNSPTEEINPLPLSPSETSQGAVHFPKRNQEFTDSLNLVQAESLQNLPKEELVKHYMHLEEKVAALHKQFTDTENEQNQEQSDDDDDDDVFVKEVSHVTKPFVFESVYNSEANSLSSNNEDFVDLSRVNQQPVAVEESSVFISDDTEPSSTNFSSSES